MQFRNSVVRPEFATGKQPQYARDVLDMSDEICRTVVITGASAGVGRAAARAFAARRSRVALIARGETGLRAAAREVEAVGGQAMVLPLDVANAEKVVAAADAVAHQWGGIDVWINCAAWRRSSRRCRRFRPTSFVG